MALFSAASTEADDLSDTSSDEFHTEVPRRCGRGCCRRPWTRRRRCCCVVGVLTLLLVLAVLGTALGLYFTGYFRVPKIECDGISPFSGSGSGKNGMPSTTAFKVNFEDTYFSCSNASFINSTYTAPAGGLYFFSLSAGTMSGEVLTYYIQDTLTKANMTSVKRSRNLAAANASDILSKEGIVQLKKGATLQAMKLGRMFEDSSDISMTAWSGFRLSAMFEPTVVFSASRTTPQDNPGLITFEQINFNLGAALNPDPKNGSFVATVNGTYYFTYSTGIAGNTTQNVSLVVNDSPLFSLTRESSNINDTDDLSRSHLLSLKEGDSVSLELVDGTLYSSQDAEAAFSGFLYAPKTTPAHAWSVYLNHSWTSAMNGSLDPVPMNNILVNDGDLFSLETSTVTVNVSGVYYIYASIGLEPNGKVLAEIKHNRVSVASVARLDQTKFGYQNGLDQLGRGIMVQADAGDTFHLWEDACPGCSILADEIHKQTTFLGFLVYALPAIHEQ